jgi:GNAT superfamily N-acetyltransferase
MIEIKTPKTREEFKAYYELRYRLLRQPWAQVKGTEKDDYEPISHHFMAVDTETNETVGVIKVYEKEAGVGCFTHMAVTSDRQRQGIGKLLMDAVEDRSRELGYHTLGCFSRLNTTLYFEQAGYRIAGLPTHYFGTTQVVWMEKKL